MVGADHGRAVTANKIGLKVGDVLHRVITVEGQPTVLSRTVARVTLKTFALDQQFGSGRVGLLIVNSCVGATMFRTVREACDAFAGERVVALQAERRRMTEFEVAISNDLRWARETAVRCLDPVNLIEPKTDAA